MKSVILIAILMIATATAGCVGGKSPEDVSGKYIAKHMTGKYMIINPDGTYRQYQEGTLAGKPFNYLGTGGDYELKGNKIVFYIPSTGESLTGRIKGNEIVIKEENELGSSQQIWVKQ